MDLVDSIRISYQSDYDKQYLLANGLNMPNGVAFKEGNLYVAGDHVPFVFRVADVDRTSLEQGLTADWAASVGVSVRF